MSASFALQLFTMVGGVLLRNRSVRASLRLWTPFGTRAWRAARTTLAVLLPPWRGTVQGGELIRAGSGNYRSAIDNLRAGDTLRRAAGIHAGGWPIHGLSDVPGRPIVIEGPLSGGRAVLRAKPGSNTVRIVMSHVVICNLELDGSGLSVDTVKAEGHLQFAHHITLDALVMRRYGNHQQTVGISTKCPALGWVIRANAIIGVGTGIQLGSPDGSAPFVCRRNQGQREDLNKSHARRHGSRL